MIVNGRTIASEILEATKRECMSLGRTVRVRALVADFSAATDSYLKIKKRQAKKAGIEMEIIPFQQGATTQDMIVAITDSNAVDALIVQLPLPASIDRTAVLDSIPLSQDADVLSTYAHHLFEQGNELSLLPPVLAAVKEILHRAHVNPNGKRAIVIGNGWLVGEPCATWLSQVGAEVTILTREASDFGLLKNAEIIISGAGSPGLIKPEHLSKDVVLIDAGTSEQGGAVVGDADPACAGVASVFTPVPGGVGPIAVACLFRNAAALAQRHGLQAD